MFPLKRGARLGLFRIDAPEGVCARPAAAIIRFSLNLVRLYGILSRPFVPDASDAILEALKLDPESASKDWPKDVGEALSALSAGHAFTVPEVLFAKITDEAREEMAARFAGA